MKIFLPLCFSNLFCLDSLSIPFLLAGVRLEDGWFGHVNRLKGEKVNFNVLENNQKVLKGTLYYRSKVCVS